MKLYWLGYEKRLRTILTILKHIKSQTQTIKEKYKRVYVNSLVCQGKIQVLNMNLRCKILETPNIENQKA